MIWDGFAGAFLGFSHQKMKVFSQPFDETGR